MVPAFGEVKDILISSCSFDQLDNPFLVTLNEGEPGRADLSGAYKRYTFNESGRLGRELGR